jgi:arylsulfatase A-like enzyme
VLPRLDAHGRQRNRRRADAVVADALQWLDAVGDARFFAWVHFYDAHAPYESPDPYRSAHRDRYDASIAFIDAQVGELLKSLERRRLMDRTVFVIVGDHGESLGDHGERTHGLFVYESVLHVPLLIRAPRGGFHGRRVSGLTRSVDVMPTALELLGLHYHGRIDGESLLPLVAGTKSDRRAFAENLYPAVRFGWSPVRTLRSGSLKIIETARPELYDLQVDPDERQNLFDRRRDLAARMLAQLREDERLIVDPPRGDPRAVDPQKQSQLGALGYISSSRLASEATQHGSPQADPKDKVAEYNRLTTPAEGATEVRR